MEIGYISNENLDIFGSLLLPQVRQAIERDEPVSAIGLTDGNVAIGAIAGYLENNIFLIASFFVAKDYRRRGGGRLLLDTLDRVLKTMQDYSGMRMDFNVTQREHEALLDFLDALGFEPEDFGEENIYQLTLEDVANTKFFQDIKPAKTGIKAFSKISEPQLKLIYRTARVNDVLLPDDLLFSDSFEKDISVVFYVKTQAEAFVVFDRPAIGYISMVCAYTGNTGPTTLLALLREAFSKASVKYTLETVLLVQTIDSITTSLLKAIMPDAKPISRTYYR